MKKLAIIEPFYKGSHKYWLDQICEKSKHEILTFTKPGVHWKWRVQQSSLLFNEEILHEVDTIITTNMVNLSAWAGNNRKLSAKKELVHYFHENQLTYPTQNKQERSFYGFFDINNAMCADRVLFNSYFHKKSFLEGIDRLSSQLPDKLPKNLINEIDKKSSILPIGLNCMKILQYKIESSNEVPIVLWNHRHEFDKNPELFFETLIDLFEEGLKFHLVVLGAESKNSPAIFQKAHEKLKEIILHWGYTQNFEEYCQWLWKSDIAPTTSNHDFFGISVLEAALCQNHLILPKKNAYPDHFPLESFSEHYYTDKEDFKFKLKNLITQRDYQFIDSSTIPLQYEWEQIIPQFDQYFA